MLSVVMAVLGVVVVAYTGSTADSGDVDYPYRALGNLVIGAGAVFYGLYEVLYKRIACPPQHVSARKQAGFANVIGSCLGFTTLLCVWPIIVVLHITGIEKFQLPRGEEFWVLTVSLLANMIFSGSFLVLMALTSPVLSSVAAILTTFLVPLVDWLLFDSEISVGELLGGGIIIAAFVLLSYASWKELQEDDDDESEMEN
jgi:drug/metabolite transporter (DMT)-like permease